MMEYDEAIELILHEGTSLDGIYMCVRERRDPGHERMAQLIEAIKTLIAHEDLKKPIDRRIAYALFVITLETEVQSDPWQKESPWRDGQFTDELMELQNNVYVYLAGDLEFNDPG